MRLPMSPEVVVESPLSEQAWLEGVKKEISKSTLFLPPRLTVNGSEVWVYLPTLTGPWIHSAFFGAFERTSGGTRVRGRFRLLIGYSVALVFIACFITFVTGFNGLSEVAAMRAGEPGHPWDAGEALLNGAAPLLAALAFWLFWKLSIWLDASNRAEVLKLLEAGAGKAS